jgi:hypothetical protein
MLQKLARGQKNKLRNSPRTLWNAGFSHFSPSKWPEKVGSKFLQISIENFCSLAEISIIKLNI